MQEDTASTFDIDEQNRNGDFDGDQGTAKLDLHTLVIKVILTHRLELQSYYMSIRLKITKQL